MELHPAQSIIANDTHRFRVVNVGRRGGKTTLAAEEMKGMAYFRTSRSCYIAPTYQQARDILWESLKKELNPIATNINESRLEIKVKNEKGEDSIIMLRGWESIETLRGQAFDFLILDEVAMMRNFWSNWQEVIRPTLTDKKGIALFISTPKGFNHFYDLYNLEAKDADFKSFHFTSYDNPHIPKEEIDKAKAELTEDRFAQEYLADFRKTEGLVYKEFSRDKHLFEKEEFESYTTIAGVDFGFTHPCAVLTIKIDTQHRYWVTDEWYHSGRTEDEIADYIAGQKYQRVYPDPENASAIATLRKRGVNVREVKKGKDSVMSGIQTVRELFKSNRLFISKNCPNLINELETYSYRDEQDMKGTKQDEIPVKEHDDAVDALRYPLMMSETQRSQAPIHYSSTTIPHSNLPQGSLPGAPRPLNPTQPKTATTYIPHLNRPR